MSKGSCPHGSGTDIPARRQVSAQCVKRTNRAIRNGEEDPCAGNARCYTCNLPGESSSVVPLRRVSRLSPRPAPPRREEPMSVEYDRAPVRLAIDRLVATEQRLPAVTV